MKKRGVSFDVLVDLGLKEEDLMRECGLGQGRRVQKAVDQAVLDYTMPYVPWRTGALAMGAYTRSHIGKGLVIYRGPNVYNLWYGNNIHQYTKTVHPLAGPYWVERMKADHMQDIVNAAKEAMKKRKKER